MSNKTNRAVGVHYDGDLRRVLVEAAAQAIAEAGPSRVSLRDVARRVGVSHAAPAHHFGDRVGLLTAVATAGFERFVVHMAGAAGGPGDGPVEVLLGMARGYVTFAEGEPGYFEVMFAPSIIDATDPAYVAASDTAFAALAAVIEGCQGAGWHPDDDNRTLAAAAWAFIHGITTLRQQGSLGRHHDDGDLAAVVRIAAVLL